MKVFYKKRPLNINNDVFINDLNEYFTEKAVFKF